MMEEKNMNEQGQGLVEYALILVLIAVVVIIAVTVLGEQVSEMYDLVLEMINSPVR